MPTRLRRRVRRAVEPLHFGIAFSLAARLDGPWSLDHGGTRIAPAEAVRLAELHLAEVLTLWAGLTAAARRRLATPSPKRPAEALADDALWAAGDRLPWAVREALGRRCPSTRRGIETLLERYGVSLAPAGRKELK